MGYARGSKKNFAVHVSSVIESSGPWAFCARYEVLSFHSDKARQKGKLTPARRLLFATGHFQHAYVIAEFRKNSEYGNFIYANWSCEDYNGEDPNDPRNADHPPRLDIFGNVIKFRCPCGKARETHNEIDLHFRKYMVVGHPDMVIRLPAGRGKFKFYLYEFKTVDRADLTFDDITMVLASHRLQVSFYYHIMKAKGMDVSRRLRVLYIDRSNRKLFGGYPYKELITHPEHPDLLQPFIDRLLLTKQGIASGRLPDRICKEPTIERAKQCDRAVECFLRRSQYLGVQTSDNADGSSSEPDQVHRRRGSVITRHRRIGPQQRGKDA